MVVYVYGDSVLLCPNGLFDWLNNLFQPIKKPVRTLSIFKSMAFVKDVKGISFKNRLKGHINWRKVRNFNII
jgi:hypothetical protein